MKIKKIFKKLIAIAAMCPLIASLLPLYAKGSTLPPTAAEAGFISAFDGAKLEYAVYGDENAEPLLLLPPNGGNLHYFDNNILPCMSQHYRVITVSMRGTGNSERGTAKMTFEVQSNDVAALLDALNISETKIFGFSDGGNLGLIFTMNFSERVTKLAIMGANINPLGTRGYFQTGVTIKYMFLSIICAFSKDAALKTERDITGLMVTQPRLTFSQLSAINIPVLNIYGEFDVIIMAHSKLITASIPDCRELMIRGGTHSGSFNYSDSVLNPALLDFFG